MPYEILVDNIPKSIDAYELACLFKSQGRIVSCNIDVDERSAFRGTGTVAFVKPSSAHSAVKDKDGYKFIGNKLRVSLKMDDFRDEMRSIMESFTKVYVKNIPPTWGEDDLREEFADFGEIKAVHVSSLEDGKSNGFGFIDFEQHSSAESAVANKPENLEVQPYLPKSFRSRTSSSSADQQKNSSIHHQRRNNLYVKGLPKSMGDEDLKKLFQTFGDIESAKVQKDGNGQSRCFGYVSFKSEEDAGKACHTMDGLNMDSKRLSVCFHQKKDERSQLLEEKRSNRKKH